MNIWARLRGWLAPPRAMAPLTWSPDPVQENETASTDDRSPADELRAVDIAAMRRQVARAFDSTHPVADRSQLFGRDAELEAIREAALDLRQHVLIHGGRGSGKTSMVRIFGDYADQAGAIVIYMACEPGASFAATLHPFLNYLPASVFAPGVHPEFERRAVELGPNAGPRAFVSLLGAIEHRQIILILDEFDRLTDSEIVGEIASFMKLLSDANSQVQLVLVGISHSVSDVIAGHPSLRRHMQITSLRRVSAQSVDAIVDSGAAASGVAFTAAAREIIKRTACGSPYHVRLFARFMAMLALRSGVDTIDASQAIAGLTAAYTEWAKTNEADAQMFARLAANPDIEQRLEGIARLAAYSDLFDPAELQAHGFSPAELGGTVIADQRNVSKSLFRDSTAPQFLIASLVVSEYSGGSAVQGT